MDLEDKLAALGERDVDRASARPTLFRLSQATDREALSALLDCGAVAVVHDSIDDQLGELVVDRRPFNRPAKGEIGELVRAHLGGTPPSHYGTWVHYPWSRRLVHVLPEGEFRELRHSRNRYKIKPDEQATLADKTIGVVGLSVGQASAITLAQEGIGRRFRLADFDTLSLSNMNRLRTSVDAIGTSKVVIAAREMYEIDPYLDIDLWGEGLNEQTVDAFLVGLDLLVEECDDLFVKIFLRERARAHRVATIMDTNERGMMDVERFDLEPERPLLHGLLADVRASDVKHLATRDKVPYMVRILGADIFSPRFVPSLMEIDQTIGSWPQLASGVALGAALVADVARRVLLNQFRGSGRYFVDLDELIREGREATLPAPTALDVPMSASSQAPPELPAVSRGGTVTREDIRRLVAHGITAPSGGNVQPWRFHARGQELTCMVDDQRAGVLLDWRWMATYLAIGAAVENMALAAAAAGISCDVQPFPVASDAATVARVSFSAGHAAEPASRSLAAHIAARTTNRRLGPRTPLDPEQERALRNAAAEAGGSLHVVREPAALDLVGRILGAGDRVRFLSERLHREQMGEVRWSPAEVETTRDGLDLATLELSRTDLAGVRLARSWNNILFLREIGGGAALERAARDSVAAASAVCLLTFPGTDPTSYFRGGRALQRIWLTATQLGLAVQPMTAILYLWARLERGDGEGLAGDEITKLRELRASFHTVFPASADTAEVMLFRVSAAGPPTARSLRRAVEDVLVFD